MTGQPLLLKVLLESKRWHAYGTFQREYNNAAVKVDKALRNTYPSRAQLHRWTSGELKGLPYNDHCRVLEQMFPDWTAEQLFAPCTPQALSVIQRTSRDQPHPSVNPRHPTASPPSPPSEPSRYTDVSAIFASRSAFSASLPPHALLDGATSIRAAGLSLNMITQQYPDQQLKVMLESGGELECLFLDPDGEAIKAREREEKHFDGTLVNLPASTLAA